VPVAALGSGTVDVLRRARADWIRFVRLIADGDAENLLQIPEQRPGARFSITPLVTGMYTIAVSGVSASNMTYAPGIEPRFEHQLRRRPADTSLIDGGIVSYHSVGMWQLTGIYTTAEDATV
jgi:hypothetical protein